MQINKNKYYIVRGNSSGVFFGHIVEKDGSEVTLTDCRRIWYWAGACSLSQLAVEGTKKPDKCRFTMPVNGLTVLDVVEIMPCTDIAVQSIQSVKVWKYDERAELV